MAVNTDIWSNKYYSRLTIYIATWGWKDDASLGSLSSLKSQMHMGIIG